MHQTFRRALLALATIAAIASATACGSGAARVAEKAPDGINDKAIFQLDKYGKAVEGPGSVKGAKKSFTFGSLAVGSVDGESLNVVVHAPAAFEGASVYLVCLVTCKDEMDTVSDTTLRPKEGVEGVTTKVFYHNKAPSTFRLLLKPISGRVIDTGGRVITEPRMGG